MRPIELSMISRGDDMREPGRDGRNDGRTGRGAGPEAGFALILALLALMLLTFLGLTLATSTSTELKIATNYRWQQQALFNAEAGIEVGKRVLSSIPNWASILPTQRTVTWDASAAPAANRGLANAPSGNSASRNFESGPCDKRGDGVGYGVVLQDSANTYQYTTTSYGQSLGGAFTLWVRRPTVVMVNGATADFTGIGDTNHLILVSEGVAPFTGAAYTSGASNNAANNASVQVIEVLLSQVTGTTQDACATRTGQAGQGAGNAGFSACDPITAGGLTSALGAASTGGRGTLTDQTTVK
jgi:PilX N-terminal